MSQASSPLGRCRPYRETRLDGARPLAAWLGQSCWTRNQCFIQIERITRIVAAGDGSKPIARLGAVNMMQPPKTSLGYFPAHSEANIIASVACSKTNTYPVLCLVYFNSTFLTSIL